jgi:nucleoside-diphosphate-sugar epimerase
MKKILVLGGTKYFGKRFVQSLIDSGNRITLGTRLQTPDPFGNAVQRICLERSNLESMTVALGNSTYDFVIDQICYSPNDAKIACEVFKNKVGHYILTSTQSVYTHMGELREADFDAKSLEIQYGTREQFTYSNAKRLAEAVFYQKAKFPVTAMRIPIVLGPDDYTGRLEFHLNRIQQNKTIVIQNLESELSLIQSIEVARFLSWLLETTPGEPINAASFGKVSIAQIIAWCEEITGSKAIIESSGNQEDHTPFIGAKTRFLQTEKAEKLGFKFDSLTDWLPKLIVELNQRF